MEGIVQLGIDRLFDNYIPCIKNRCDEEHEENLIKSIMIMLMKHG